MSEESIFSELLTGLTLTDPAKYAAGPLAIQKSVDHLITEMGAIRAFKAINAMNKTQGFDCPGCAWPDPDDRRSVLGEYCENGAKALAEEATLSKVGQEYFARYSLSELRSLSDYEIGKAGRLTTPMMIRQGQDHYEPIKWQEAFELIAKHLMSLEDPNEAVFYTSGRSSNEAAYLYSLLARRLGTNNLPDCSNMCHESSGVALSKSLGIGKGSVTLDDLYKAQVIMILGQNPGTNHPRMLTALQKAKANGAKVITINPLEEAGLKRFRNPQRVRDMLGAGTMITDVYLPVRINEDVSLLKAIQKDLIKRHDESGDILDQGFIEHSTNGYEAMRQDLQQYTIEALLTRSGIGQELYEQAMRLLRPASKIVICWAMGLTQHENGIDNISECVNLLLMKGSIGKEGAGTCPVRGHSNVQGDRTVGINHKISEAMRLALQRRYQIDIPAVSGYDVVESIMAMHEGKAKIFMALGGNFMTAASDTFYTREAIESCDLTVSIATKLNRTHLHPGKVGLLLPTLGRSERDISGQRHRYVSVENSMGKVQPSQGVLTPISDQLMSEPSIIAQLGRACYGEEDAIPWSDYDQDYNTIRADIAKVVEGFDSYNERIKGGAEFYLPNNAREGDFSKLPGGRAQFTICSLPNHQLRDDEFLLMTIRSHDQFNTTIYGLDDRYRGIYGERRVVLMNVEDMVTHKLQNKDLISLESCYDGKVRRVDYFHAVAYQIPRGNLAAYFPETNPLIPIDRYARESQTPISKSVKVTVHKMLETS